MSGLEALNKIDNEVLYGVYAQEHYSNELTIIRKSLKALEIIKEKNVDIRWIEVCDTVKDYNKGKDEHLNYELTLEEFNLLKEVLE